MDASLTAIRFDNDIVAISVEFLSFDNKSRTSILLACVYDVRSIPTEIFATRCNVIRSLITQLVSLLPVLVDSGGSVVWVHKGAGKLE